jgi:predicted transcriptional regulator
MKYRLGFVSNSSSSSFIIAYNSDKIKLPCPYCKRSNIDLLEFIDMSGNGSHNTKIDWCHVDTHIQELENENNIRQDENRRYYYLQDQGKTTIEKYGNTYKINDFIMWNNEYIRDNIDMIDKLRNAKEQNDIIFECSIDNHDSTLRELIHTMESSGDIKILSSNEE